MTSTTRRRILFFAPFLPLLSRFGTAQNSVTPSETASVLNKHMGWMEHDFIPAAEAMPEDKFFWAPKNGEFHGVRTFAEQIAHVAELNMVLSAAILGEEPPAETPPEVMKAKSAVVRYLMDSFTYTHRALSSITEQNAKLPIKHPILDMVTTRMGLGIVTIAHSFNHYGQMVEYLRMNNVVPPASRQ